jgi:hypothetical protein
MAPHLTILPIFSIIDAWCCVQCLGPVKLVFHVQEPSGILIPSDLKRAVQTSNLGLHLSLQFSLFLYYDGERI